MRWGYAWENVLLFVFPSVGLGKFHVLLVVICGWANATDSVEVACISLVLTSLQCDMQATSEDLGWLTAVIFIGEILNSPEGSHSPLTTLPSRNDDRKLFLGFRRRPDWKKGRDDWIIICQWNSRVYIQFYAVFLAFFRCSFS